MEQSTRSLAAYQRVAEVIKGEIRTGTLSPGDRLPSHRAVAEKYGVALGTAQKALKLLEDDGWLTVTPSVGVFVSESMPTENTQGPGNLNDVRVELGELRQALDALTARVEALEARGDRSR
ncbi:GntR family transcriptional regulator [Saccharomonospora xinjiangensis]|uniref:GntR family transcriptional regulator n=1 Tax=Saccharomonospora xinjiangensis TaxID=75294 RepID=UPI00107003FA|nr:winged helix-turn-helix domain-containing protein [Saccharomonospora xinjiangensis]